MVLFVSARSRAFTTKHRSSTDAAGLSPMSLQCLNARNVLLALVHLQLCEGRLEDDFLFVDSLLLSLFDIFDLGASFLVDFLFAAVREVVPSAYEQ